MLWKCVVAVALAAAAGLFLAPSARAGDGSRDTRALGTSAVTQDRGAAADTLPVAYGGRGGYGRGGYGRGGYGGYGGYGRGGYGGYGRGGYGRGGYGGYGRGGYGGY